MTIAELERAIASKNRLKQAEEKEHATFDYILASMIARGVQSAICGGEGIPDITEVYSSLFVDDLKKKEQEQQALKDELSALRFRQYANFHNERIAKEVAKPK